jgi:hypothetical protein
MNLDPVSNATRAAFEGEFLRWGAHGRNWPRWSQLFTDDAVYTEHVMGRFVGPAGIEAFLAEGMKPVAPMTFSLEWHTVEGNRLAFWIWNHLPAPEGSEGEFCFPNMSIIEHDGNGKWTMEEDLYDPSWAGDAVMAWYTAGGSPAMSPDPSLRPRTPSHPKPPAVGPDRATVAQVLAQHAPEGTTLRLDVIDGAVGVGVFDSAERAYGVVVHVDFDGTVTFSAVFTNPAETINPCL